MKKWIIHNANADKDEELFHFNDQRALRSDMMTLDTGKEVNATVIDTWACVLNDNEREKPILHPTRFFASTKLMMETVVGWTGTRAQQLKLFKKKMKSEMTFSPYKKWAEIDMVS
ncbi:PREDICTED: uncharacterized protein LOC109177111 [Ipomoea nil]|uniref:uncharacterized protein LOC109177111 n=1 Tax=Ipomoea nil TaxID=35883 RepID=UPI00090153C1|nr:PREDICTED: uncharacterized protein LOC109177111 [Ipomoea nil]